MDQAHAHPPSEPGRPLSSLRNKHSSFRAHPNASSLVPQPQPREAQFSLQHKRLQLRNTGFRAPRIQTERISPRFSKLFHGYADPDESDLTIDQNQGNTSPGSPPSTVSSGQHSSHRRSILHEITSSARSLSSRKSPVFHVTEDNSNQSHADCSAPTSWYHDTPSEQQSPLESEQIYDCVGDMKLRDISGNVQRSPPALSSPLATHIKGRKKRGLDLRKTSFQASQYIEHIENELEEVKLSLQSPGSGQSLHDRLKTQKAEITELKHIISELENNFEGRLREAVEHKTATELELRRRIKTLEDDLVEKDGAISCLESQNEQSPTEQSCMESLKATVERLELEKRGLEDANRTIEKRNDTLTKLLGHSPTRTQHGLEIASPIRDGVQKTPRPRSMMTPIIPSSPRTAYFCRPVSVQASPADGGLWNPLSALAEARYQNCSTEKNMGPPKKPDDVRSVDSGIGDSCSVSSHAEQGSKHSSLLSQSSVTPSAWGLPLSSSPVEEIPGSKESRKRKTRRFASGSTSLKPLVLPAMAAASTLAQSTPCRRRGSDQSVDPTTSFLSQPFEIPAYRSLPSQAGSTTWASEDALKALEGENDQYFGTFEEVFAEHEAIITGRRPQTFLNEVPEHLLDESDEGHSPSSSLDEGNNEDSTMALPDVPNASIEEELSFSSMAGEISKIEQDVEVFEIPNETFASQCLDMEIPATLIAQPELRDGRYYDFEHTGQRVIISPVTLEPPQTFQPSFQVLPIESLDHIEQPHLGLDSLLSMNQTCEDSSDGIKNDSLLNPQRQFVIERSCSPLETLRRRSTSPVPITSITARTIFGTISRYTSYIQEVRRDPTALARRVMANAWRSNWKRLGRLSWWVLGLFLGQGVRRKEYLKRWCGVGWDLDQYCAEDIAERTHDEMNGPGPSTLMDESDKLQVPSDLGLPSPETPLLDTRRVTFIEIPERCRTSGTETMARPALKAEENREEGKQKASWGKSLYLWGKFSVAILLAVGGAVVKGPGEMLKDCDFPQTHRQTTNSQRHSRMSDFDHPVDGNAQDECFDHSLDRDTCREALNVHRGSLQANTGKVSELSPALTTSSKLVMTRSPERVARQNFGPATSARPLSFGTPSQDQWDRFDDNGRARPALIRRNEGCELQDIFGQDDLDESDECGELKWTTNLSVSDFQAVGPSGTIKARSHNKVGEKRTHSLIS